VILGVRAILVPRALQELMVARQESRVFLVFRVSQAFMARLDFRARQVSKALPGYKATRAFKAVRVWPEKQGYRACRVIPAFKEQPVPSRYITMIITLLPIPTLMKPEPILILVLTLLLGP
jgi:hypothetical protein